jgi:hypothetical protein
MSDYQFNTPEVWKAIPDFPGYEVSDQGRVRSYWTHPANGPSHLSDNPQKILKQRTHTGRWIIQLVKDGHKHCQRVHRLVLAAFIGPCPVSMECCHNDGNGFNNILTNLRWDTRRNNHKDKIKHGTHPEGEKNNLAKLSGNQVIEIRSLAEQGIFHKDIAERFGVARPTISKIVGRKRWTHI